MRPEDFMPICAFLDDEITGDGRPRTRFALLVWDMDSGEPTLVGSNDAHTPRILKMLEGATRRINDAAPIIDAAKLPTVGNA